MYYVFHKYVTHSNIVREHLEHYILYGQLTKQTIT